jgi:MFS family permease
VAARRSRFTILTGATASSDSTKAESATTPLDLHQRLLAVGLVLSVMLVAFEVTAVITALPTITDELGGDSLYGVSLACYTLANLVALVAGGELSDRRGPVVPFCISVVLFVAGLVVAATASSMVMIVVGRTLQGAGTGGFSPIAYVLVKRAFPTDRHAAMYAFLSAGWVLPSLFAPAIAGWITDSFGWPWVFWGIIPLAVAVGALAAQPMRRYGPVEGVAISSRVPQALVAAGGIGALVVGLQFANPLAAVSTSIVGAGFAVVALRRLLPPGFGRARQGFAALIAVRIAATAAFLGVDSFVPLAADRIHGASPLVQGFVIIGAALTWTVGQWYRVRYPGSSPAAAIRQGFVVLLLGIGLVVPVLSASWPLAATFAAWAVGGLGMGLLFNPSTTASMSYASEGNEGLVSGQVTLADAVGFSLMGGIGGATVALADRTSWPLTSALSLNFALAAGLAIVGILASRNVRAAA